MRSRVQLFALRVVFFRCSSFSFASPLPVCVFIQHCYAVSIAFSRSAIWIAMWYITNEQNKKVENTPISRYINHEPRLKSDPVTVLTFNESHIRSVIQIPYSNELCTWCIIDVLLSFRGVIDIVVQLLIIGHSAQFD